MVLIEPAIYKRILNQVVILPLLTMVLLAMMLFWQVQTLVATSRLVDHTDQVIAQAHYTLKLALDAETGQRGYLVGGKRLFLEPFTRAEREFPLALKDLSTLVADNLPQAKQVQIIQADFTQWATNARREMTVREQGQNYQSVFNEARGKDLMDDLRTQFDAFVTTEQGLRAKRSRAAQQTSNLAVISVWVLTLLLGALLAFLTGRQMTTLVSLYMSSLNQIHGREQLLSVTLTSIGDAVLTTDAQGKVTFLNPIAERLTGWTREAAQAQDATKVFCIINEETRQPVESPLMRVLREGVVVGLANHTILIHKEGAETPIDDSGAPIRDDKDNVIGSVLVFRDITERNRTEQERKQLLEEEHTARLRAEAAEKAKAETVALLDTLLETAPVGFAFFDHHLRYMRVNDALAAINGIPAPEHIGHTVTELLPGIAPDIVQGLSKVLETGTPLLNQEVQGETLATAGQERYWLVSYYPVVTEDAKTLGIGTIVVDISERKRQEDEIVGLNQRLQRAMEETHHRVRNNLQIIAAMVDMQKMEYAQAVPIEELGRLSSHIRTLSAVHDLLTEQAKQDGQAQFVSVQDLLERLLPMLEQTAPNHYFRYELTDAFLTTRRATSLALITNELVTNAIKYGKSEITVTFTIEGDRGVLIVTDDGPGLPEGFDPVRSANTGLSLVGNLSRWDLKGLVRYENSPAGGAKITVTFPLSAPQEISVALG